MEEEIVPKKILDRIEALFKLAKSDNSTEAENAQKSAQRLITKYNLDEAVIRAKEGKKEEEPTKKIVWWGGKTRIMWREQLIKGILEINGCCYIISDVSDIRKTGVHYWGCGTPTNLSIAEKLILHIENQINYLAQSKVDISGKTGKNSYRLGLVRGVIKRLKEGKEEAIQTFLAEADSQTNKNALMTYNKYLVEAQEALPKLFILGGMVSNRKPNLKDSDYQKGITDSKKINTTVLPQLKK